jgi:predicted acetyltransferase
MSASFRYRAPDDHEIDALASLLAVSFGVRDEDAPDWLERAGRANLRIARSGGNVVGGVLLVPMGQYFLGKRVAMTGIAGVGVPPTSARGEGVATRMMQETVRELYREQIALSALFPATVRLYRRAGYEFAGVWPRVDVPVRDLPRWRELEVRTLTSADEAAVRRIYAAHAKQRNGWLDRGPYVWERTRREREGRAVRCFVLARGPSIEGYVCYRQHPFNGGHDLEITDWGVSTVRAMRSLIAFVGEHRSLARNSRWLCAANDPLLMLIDERWIKQRVIERWMLRIVHVERALEQRGYPRAVDTSVAIEVRDDHVRANRDRFALELAGGKCRVTRGGRSPARLDVGALAALYSGFSSASALRALGRIDASDETIARLEAVFAAPQPSMPDMF